jgi:hypothetical protein
MNTVSLHNERPADGTLRPLAVPVNTACLLTGLGATKLWSLIRDGRLDVVRVDRRTLIKFASLEKLLNPESQPAPRKTPRRKGAQSEPPTRLVGQTDATPPVHSPGRKRATASPAAKACRGRHEAQPGRA